MLSEQVRDRIRQLQSAHRATETVVQPGGVTNSANPILHTRFRALAERANSPLEPETLPGRETHTTAGPCWLIRRTLSELWPESRRYVTRAIELSAQLAATTPYEDRSIRADLNTFCAAFPHRIAVLDIETCGLAGSIVFLIGILHSHAGQLYLSQYWARSYAEERAVLTAVRELLSNQQVLVTFNGKSFDWPQIRDRSTLHERDPDSANNRLVHLDLLHHARRRWRYELPNCKLQTLERYICGRHRTGDIPGGEIPAAYHDYVRTGTIMDVRAILHHNALDLVTLLQLSLLFIPVT